MVGRSEFERINCDSCGSSKYRLYRKNSGMDIVKCRNCGLVYVNPQPTWRYLEDFYNEGEYTEERWDYISPYRNEVKRGHKKVVDYLKKNIGAQEVEMLDIGAGMNNQYGYIKKLGWTLTGTELSKTFVKWAKKKGWNVIFGDIIKMKFPSKKFDTITMMAVVEHLKSPTQYFNECHRILKDKGILIFKIPNLHYTLMNSTKLALSEQMHLFHYTPKTIKRHLAKCGFKVIKNVPVLECGSDNRIKNLVMMFWSRLSKIIYSLSGIHTDLQMTIYAKKSSKVRT